MQYPEVYVAYGEGSAGVEAVAPHRLGERGNHLVARRTARVDALDGVPPPLQTHLAERRLAHHLGGLGDLQVEGVEGEEVLAPPGRREQAGQVAVVVKTTDLIGAVRRSGGGHGTLAGAAENEHARL